MLAPTPYFADRGCHVRIYEEARALRTQGHDVRIVTYHLGRDMPDITTIRIPSICWYKRLEAGPSWHKLYLDLLLFFKAMLLIPEFRPDLIHAHMHEGAFIGYFLKRLSGLPLILDYQGSLTGECIDHGFFGATSRIAGIFRRIEQMINGFADRIITSSGAGTAELVNTWGVRPQIVTPLIDAVDTDVFHPAPTQAGREALGIPHDTFVVAYLGILSRYQGTDLLLDCIELLKKDGIKVFFLIMGFPDTHYREEALARGLADMTCFIGKVDYKEAPLMLSAADITVTPKLSPTEANGKIFNYMACGLPVVAFDTPVNREVLGDTGIYAYYGDARDLADKIAALVTDSCARAHFSEQVREKALREHSWNSRGKLLTAVYQTMLSRQP
ncbi:MAG: glycosyltransferase family 4 protein [Desulfuromonadales bacterium]|nr:glycosyltransferase family 4 protein [Desulfuromonadales bacterium]